MALPIMFFLCPGYSEVHPLWLPYGSFYPGYFAFRFSISLTAQAFQRKVRSRSWQPALVPLLWLSYGCPNFAYVSYGFPMASLISCSFPMVLLWLWQPPCLLSSSPMAPLWHSQSAAAALWLFYGSPHYAFLMSWLL